MSSSVVGSGGVTQNPRRPFLPPDEKGLVGLFAEMDAI